MKKLNNISFGGKFNDRSLIILKKVKIEEKFHENKKRKYKNNYKIILKN